MHIHLTRRWIQSLINHLMSHEAFLIGLTNVKNFQEYTLNHSVNVCILSLALGRRLGLSRPELIELGISACLHDVGKFEIPDEDPGQAGQTRRRKNGRSWNGIPTSGRGSSPGGEDNRGHSPDAAIQVALEHHIKPGLAGISEIRAPEAGEPVQQDRESHRLLRCDHDQTDLSTQNVYARGSPPAHAKELRG